MFSFTAAFFEWICKSLKQKARTIRFKYSTQIRKYQILTIWKLDKARILEKGSHFDEKNNMDRCDVSWSRGQTWGLLGDLVICLCSFKKKPGNFSPPDHLHIITSITMVLWFNYCLVLGGYPLPFSNRTIDWLRVTLEQWQQRLCSIPVYWWVDSRILVVSSEFCL